MAEQQVSWLDQNEKLLPLLEKPHLKGEEWYVIDHRWLKQWKDYIGANDVPGGQETNYPGTINNENIIDKTLDPLPDYGHFVLHNISENVNYSYVPKEVWTTLKNVYGYHQMHPIKREVVEMGDSQTPTIELHLIHVRLTRIEDRNNLDIAKDKYYSCKVTIDTVCQDTIKLFDCKGVKNYRIWSKYKKWTLLKGKYSLDQVGLKDGEILYLETTKSSSFDCQKQPDILAFQNGTEEEPMDYCEDQEMDNYDEMSVVSPCGLSNMGNTCFMNSALQCLVSVGTLTHYFVSNKWKQDLNKSNPLGMRGEVAKAYADLVKEMHSSAKQMHSVLPRQFKIAVSRFAPQFSGWAQHDSQELLAFLLDGLHEDLNRIKDKPYVETREADGRPEDKVARDSWKDYTKRNDSVVVDTFHGQLKSTLVCPKCSHVSVTFDPFCYLSLPLPQIRNRCITIILLGKSPISEPTELHVKVEKQGRILNLCESVAQAANDRLPKDSKERINHENLIVVEVHSGHISKIYNPGDAVSMIMDKDYIRVFELAAVERGVPRDKYKLIGVYERVPAANSYHKSFKTVGNPFVLAVPIEINYDTLLDMILVRMKRYIKHSDKIEKFEEVNKLNGESEDASEPFALRLVNMYGNAQVAEMTLKTPLKQNENVQYVALDWESDENRKFFLDPHEERYVKKEDAPANLRVKDLQLNDCLELFTSEEKLSESDPWYCPKCKKHQQATKKLDLWSLPDILVVHLKRFSYCRWWRDKIDSLVYFPTKDLNLKKYVLDPSIDEEDAIYDLLAVSNHFGGMGGGHYTAFSRRGTKWVNLDDSCVSRIAEESVVNRSAYVLFYERRNPKKRTLHCN
ncbi:DgyrCDS13151 [Dimorphilus gyrociliatus]|uniref:Ubiquitin carboxyl-terminal hydrolase n=1 Tax=Dimorphilus gyrociliatus TaxID=2664684 RepID=A0A7I8W9W0_9ANNE|nr:DgyrCDS13151 [Dimorphilus gyrociliatus]